MKTLAGIDNEKFEYHGEWYSTEYNISTLSDLVEAMKIQDMLLECTREYEPDSNHPCFYLVEKQRKAINDYLSRFKDYDKSILLKNINYLLKSNNLRIGELEQILGISNGYISRTAKADTEKKLSIDIVWKISQLFGVSIRELLESNLEIPNSNFDMLYKFILKLTQQTECNEITWKNRGGYTKPLYEPLWSLKLFLEDIDDSVLYGGNEKLVNRRCELIDDVYSYKITPAKELLIISYNNGKGSSDYFLDFYFVSILDTNSPSLLCSKAFSLFEDEEKNYLGDVLELGEKLLEKIQMQEMDSCISQDTRNFIASYLNNGGI